MSIITLVVNPEAEIDRNGNLKRIGPMPAANERKGDFSEMLNWAIGRIDQFPDLPTIGFDLTCKSHIFYERGNSGTGLLEEALWRRTNQQRHKFPNAWRKIESLRSKSKDQLKDDLSTLENSLRTGEFPLRNKNAIFVATPTAVRAYLRRFELFRDTHDCSDEWSCLGIIRASLDDHNQTWLSYS